MTFSPATSSGVRLPGHQALALQAVQETHHRGAVDPETSGGVLLGLGLMTVEKQEDRQLAGIDSTGGQVLAVQLLELEERPLEQVAEPRTERGRAPLRCSSGKRTASLIVSRTDDQEREHHEHGTDHRRLSGLVGSRLLPRLADDGTTCRALIRRDLALPAGAIGVRGDLGDPSSLRAAVEGVDAVVHLAALFRTTDEGAIWRANLDGTRNLVEAVATYAPRGPLHHGQHRQRLRSPTPRGPDARPTRARRPPPTRPASWPPRRFCARAG